MTRRESDPEEPAGDPPTRAPTRAEVRDRLARLADGSLDPDEASQWAWAFDLADIQGTLAAYGDPVVESGIYSLLLAYIPDGDANHRLYGALDFAAWLEEFDAEAQATPEP